VTSRTAAREYLSKGEHAKTKIILARGRGPAPEASSNRPPERLRISQITKDHERIIGTRTQVYLFSAGSGKGNLTARIVISQTKNRKNNNQDADEGKKIKKECQKEEDRRRGGGGESTSLE